MILFIFCRIHAVYAFREQHHNWQTDRIAASSSVRVYIHGSETVVGCHPCMKKPDRFDMWCDGGEETLLLIGFTTVSAARSSSSSSGSGGGDGDGFGSISTLHAGRLQHPLGHYARPSSSRRYSALTALLLYVTLSYRAYTLIFYHKSHPPPDWNI